MPASRFALLLIAVILAALLSVLAAWLLAPGLPGALALPATMLAALAARFIAVRR